MTRSIAGRCHGLQHDRPPDSEKAVAVGSTSEAQMSRDAHAPMHEAFDVARRRLEALTRRRADVQSVAEDM